MRDCVRIARTAGHHLWSLRLLTKFCEQADNMSDENSSHDSNPFEDDGSDIGGLSTSFGSDEGSQAEEAGSSEEERDSSPVRRAPARRQGARGGGGGRQGNSRGRDRDRGEVAPAGRTAAPPRARTTTRGAGRGRSRRPVKGAAKFCGRCGSSIKEKDEHSHKGCGRTYFYKFSVS